MTVHNSATTTNERSLIVMHNCTIAKNQAGKNLLESTLYGTESVGGAMSLIGNRVDLELTDSSLVVNQASHGGAISIEAIAECNIARNTWSRSFCMGCRQTICDVDSEEIGLTWAAPYSWR